MALEFRLPELGENIQAGTVVRVLVQPGQTIAREAPVLEMETDKAVVEVPCTFAGRVTQIHVKEGDQAQVGQLILTLEAGDETAAAPPTPPPQKKTEPAPAPKGAPAPPPPPVSSKGTLAAPAATPSRSPVAAAPSVRQFAREIGVDIAQVTPGAEGGRITIEDVKRFAKELNTTRASATLAAAGVPASALPDFAKWGSVERQPMSAVRRKTAAHMALAGTTIPHVTHFGRADVTKLEDLRKKFVPRAEKAGGKLTITAILLKVAAAALKVFPKFNASVDISRSEIILKKYIHIGVAVDTERGLLVPVIRDVEQKNIVQLAVELAQAAQRARGGKITMEEMQGGSFTITNLGGLGGGLFTPIINYPEVAILGVGRATQEPVFRGDCCAPRLMLPLSLSYDHRVIDGADGARFLQWIVEAMEEPLLIPLEG
jgi:pyruvate dehydrogenase E2 component (dihydrolipoamide acetyltransferase)